MSDHKPVRVRRSYSDAFKREVVAETHEPGVSIAAVARRHGINANVVFGWLRDPRFGSNVAPMEFLPVATSTTPMMAPTPEKRPDPLDLTVEFPGGVRVHCRDKPSLIAVLRAARRAS
jgi:transposase-like protein